MEFGRQQQCCSEVFLKQRETIQSTLRVLRATTHKGLVSGTQPSPRCDARSSGWNLIRQLRTSLISCRYKRTKRWKGSTIKWRCRRLTQLYLFAYELVAQIRVKSATRPILFTYTIKVTHLKTNNGGALFAVLIPRLFKYLLHQRCDLTSRSRSVVNTIKAQISSRAFFCQSGPNAFANYVQFREASTFIEVTCCHLCRC
jgi:hypothetical protein